VKEKLGRVSTDFWGPYYIPTLNGERYMLTFTDHYSRKSWVYLAKERTELRTLFMQWRAYAELQSGEKLKILQCNNAKEFKSLGAELKEEGVAIEDTVRYTPEQNGIAERLNRTLITLARAMIIDAGVPQKLWGDAALAANHIRNRLPTRITGKTPDELWLGVQPTIAHLRVWGCLCYVQIPRDIRKKLDSVAEPRIFMGYEDMLRQYKLLDPNTDAYERAASVDFYENETWGGQKLPSINLTDEEEEGFIQESDEEDLYEDLNLHSKRAPKHSVGVQLATDTEQPTTNHSKSPSRDEENISAKVQPARGSDNQPQAESLPAAAPAENIRDMGQDLPQVESQAEPEAAEPQSESEGESIASGSILAAAIGNRQSRYGREIRLRNVYDPSPGNSRQRGNKGVGRQGLSCGQRGAARAVQETAQGQQNGPIPEITIPESYSKVLNDKRWSREWKEAIDAELTALLANGTWKYVDRPEGINIVDNKWVFDLKDSHRPDR
jgi:hypothetical protein